jgi:hypothetical protein
MPLGSRRANVEIQDKNNAGERVEALYNEHYRRKMDNIENEEQNRYFKVFSFTHLEALKRSQHETNEDLPKPSKSSFYS